MYKTVIQELRKKSRTPLRSISQAFRQKDPTISSIENGKRTAWRQLQNDFADYYGVPVGELFDLVSGLAKPSQSSTDTSTNLPTPLGQGDAQKRKE